MVETSRAPEVHRACCVPPGTHAHSRQGYVPPLTALPTTCNPAGQTRLTMEPSWEAIRSSLTESLSQMSNLLLEVVQPTWRPTLGRGGEKREMAVHPQPVTLTPHTTSYREQLVSVMASRGVSSTAPPSLTSHQRQQQPLGPVPERVAEEGSSRAEEGGSPHGVSPLERGNFKMLLLNW